MSFKMPTSKDNFFFLQILIDLIIHGRGSARESALAKKFKYCYFREEENTVEN